MEIRVLKYFLAVAQEGNITRAAERLYVTQPTLSKQLKDLEAELGQRLFTRSNYSIVLTEAGMLLKNRALDIISLVDKTTREFKSDPIIDEGEVSFGCAESHLMIHIAKILKSYRNDFPRVTFNLTSGGTELVLEKLEQGLLDFGIIVEPPNLSKYHCLEIPGEDVWGLVIKRDHPLAKKDFITKEDLLNVDLICSKQSMVQDLPRWCGDFTDKLKLVATVNLPYNGSILVKSGIGCMLMFKHLIDTSIESDLCFRALKPKLVNRMFLIWKKYQIHTPFVQVLLDRFSSEFG